MRDAKRLHEGTLTARSQIVWLTLGGMVAIGVTFALGVMVGRRAERLVAAQHEAPMDPLKRIEDERKIQDELTFYARLTQPKSDHYVAAPLPTSKTKAPDTTKMVATDALDQSIFAAPPPAAKADTSAVRAPAAVVVAPSAALAAASAAAPTVAPASSPTVAPTSAPAVAAPAAHAAEPAPAGLAAGRAKSGQYTIQVSSFQTADEANAYAASLTRKGYAPYVVSTAIAGKGTWHRVRVGAFPTSEAANAAKAQLVSADIPGWVLKAE